MKLPEKKVLIGIILIIVIGAIIIITENKDITGKSVNTQEVQIMPLTPEQRAQVQNSILTSIFIQDIPKKESIGLRFFTFQEGERIWQDGYLIGKNQLLTEGTPSIYLTLHSKYIPELKEGNLCDIIKKAKENGDLGFHSEYSKTRLFIKFAAMLKHRKCFGF